MKLRMTLAASALVVLAVAVSAAFAGPGKPGPATCSGGEIQPGHYKGLVVTGVCSFADGKIDIDGDLVVADGASLNDHAAAANTTVHVKGNVLVGKHAVLGLGNYDPKGKTEVDGNVVADQPMTLYIGGVHVHGNVTSLGGGTTPEDGFRNFPLKDDRVDGNVTIVGWHGGWLGVIRVHAGGDVIVAENVSTEDPDSNEVQTNDVHGDLICEGNSPAAQVNPNPPDSGQPNTVHGSKLGECSGL